MASEQEIADRLARLEQMLLLGGPGGLTLNQRIEELDRLASAALQRNQAAKPRIPAWDNASPRELIGTGSALAQGSGVSLSHEANSPYVVVAADPTALSHDDLADLTANNHHARDHTHIGTYGVYPTDEAWASSTEASVATSHTADLPTGIVVGQTILVFFGTGATPGTVTWPAGWTQFLQDGTPNAFYIAYREADGTEGATITITTANAVKSAHLSVRIAGAAAPSDDPPEGTAASGSASAPDPPAHTATLTKQYLVIAFGWHGDSLGSITAAPSGYADYIDAASADPMGSDDAEVAAATKEVEGLTENPGAFTATNVAWKTATIFVHPMPVAGLILKEAGVQLGDPNILTLDFGAGFDLTESPDQEVNVALDLSEITAGGELGGNMDAPTVDVTHSGSSHASIQAAAEATAAAELATHVAAADPHTGYRLESADHSHASTGLEAGQLDAANTHGSASPDTHHAEAHGIAAHTAHANWKALYTDGSGGEQEIALGAAGTILAGQGVAAAPAFDTMSGDASIAAGGVVTVAGTHAGTAHHARPHSHALSADGSTLSPAILTLPKATVPTPTAEGQVYWDSDDNKLVIGDGAAQQHIVPTASVSGDATMDTAGALTVEATHAGTAHHAESHTIASHSDTTATGAELEELTDGSTTTLHAHAGGGAPSDAQYLVLAANATLTVERVFTPGTALSAVDSGAGAAYTLNHAQVATGDLHTEYLLADGSRPLSGDLDLDGNNLIDSGVIFLREQAAADADVEAQGQYWVKTATPNEPYFTDDAGNDRALIWAGGAFHDGFSDFVADEHVAHSGVTITAGVGLSGGGTIDGNVSLAVDLNELTTETSIAAGDFLAMVDITDSGSGKITLANLEATISHDNIAGVSADDHHAEVHDHTTADGSGVLTADEHDSFSEYAQIAAPSTPAAAKARLYPKTDGRFYSKDDAGVEYTVSVREGAIFIHMDGGGSVLTTGKTVWLVIPYNIRFSGWTLIADQSGSLVVDVNLSTYAAFPTTASIAGTEKPTLSSVQKNQDLSLTTWTDDGDVDQGEVLEFEIDSATTVTKATLTLNFNRR